MTGDTAIRRLTAGAVLLVAAIAAVVSYLHIAELALSHGQGRLAAYLLPVSIDGAVVVASLALLRAARVGLATPRPAQALLVAAIAATLAANLAAGAPYGPVGMAVSGWPAAAFLGCCEIAVAMVRRERGAPVAFAYAESTESAALPALGSTRDGIGSTGGSGTHATVAETTGQDATEPPDSHDDTDPVLADAERAFAAEIAAGTLPSIRRVRSRLHLGQDRGKRVHAHLARVHRERVHPVAQEAHP